MNWVKFGENKIKLMDFSLRANFETSAVFYETDYIALEPQY